MKYIFFLIFFLVWAIITIISVVLIIPLLMLMETQWFDYPSQIIKKC